MNSFEKILVPIDFSAHSAEATRTAAGLAQRFEGELTLVHVYDPLIYAFPDSYAAATPAELDRLLDGFKAELEGARRQALEAGAPRVETRLLHGFIAGEIIEFAKRGEMDLIVMGTHGRTGLAQLIIGSIAERVVRLSPCPVLTVKVPGSRPSASPAPM
jgi:universal stress protein A